MIDHLRLHHEWFRCFSDTRGQENVQRAGFWECAQIHAVANDRALLTALVEHWWPKTNTFHLPTGEMTITLQDVGIILGLRVHGPAVTGEVSEEED